LIALGCAVHAVPHNLIDLALPIGGGRTSSHNNG
jgi:hypothetical protein